MNKRELKFNISVLSANKINIISYNLELFVFDELDGVKVSFGIEVAKLSHW